MAVRVRGWGWGRASRQSCRRRCEKIKPVFTAGPPRCEITPFTVSRCEGVGHVLGAVLLAGVDEVVVAVPAGCSRRRRRENPKNYVPLRLGRAAKALCLWSAASFCQAPTSSPSRVLARARAPTRPAESVKWRTRRRRSSPPSSSATGTSTRRCPRSTVRNGQSSSCRSARHRATRATCSRTCRWRTRRAASAAPPTRRTRR